MIEVFSGIYCGPPPGPDGLWARWNLDPPLLAALAAASLAIARSRPGPGAILALALIFVSPLCALSSALFSARAVHHVVLVAVAAPLAAAALPRRRTGPLTFHFATSTAALWIWHAPAAYDLALSDMGVYWLMQATLFIPALLFWRAVLSRDASPAGALLFITGGYVQMALLGAVIAFAPDTLYAIHRTAPLAWGMAPLADQQLGGLVMWVPGGLPYALIAALVARRGWGASGGVRA